MADPPRARNRWEGKVNPGVEHLRDGCFDNFTMTTIRSGAPRVAAPSTTQVSRATTASTSSAATGTSSPAVASSFQAATAAPSPGLQSVLNGAKDALKDVSGGDKDALLKMLDSNYAKKDVLEKGMEAFNNLAQSGELDEGQLNAIKKAVGWRLAGRQVVSSMLSQMEKTIGEITKKRSE